MGADNGVSELQAGKTFWQQEWVGLKQFERLFTDQRFLRVIRNTIVMSSMNLFIGTAVAILFTSSQ